MDGNDVTMGPRERLIDGAIDLMRRKGVAGMGLAELLEHSATARRSLYVHFPGGKAELVAEATRTVGPLMENAVDVLATDASGRALLAAFIDSWKEALRSSDFTAGCPVVAAMLGRSEAPSAADAAGEVLASWQSMVAHRLGDEGVEHRTAESLATTVVAAVEGAVILCLADQSTEPLDRTGRMLDQLLGLHTA